MHTRESAEKCLRSPSVFVTFVQFENMDGPQGGVAQALAEGSAQGSTSLSGEVSSGPVKFEY